MPINIYCNIQQYHAKIAKKISNSEFTYWLGNFMSKDNTVCIGLSGCWKPPYTFSHLILTFTQWHRYFLRPSKQRKQKKLSDVPKVTWTVTDQRLLKPRSPHTQATVLWQPSVNQKYLYTEDTLAKQVHAKHVLTCWEIKQWTNLMKLTV